MFSIVIPLYNKELSILNTLNSVRRQLIQEFEIIIVNDGSTDSSLEVVSKLKDERITIINQCNGGVSSARNAGIKAAKFKWIAFLDGDDIWEKKHLSAIVEMINSFSEAKLFATSFRYSDGRVIQRNEMRERLSVIVDYFKESMDEHLIWTSVFVAHKDCFQSDLFNEKLALGEDIELFGRLVKKFSFVKSNEITATYRVEAENRSNVGAYRIHMSFLSMLDFSSMNSFNEKKYYINLIFNKLKYFIVSKDWKNVLFLIKRYHIYFLYKL